MLALLLSFVAGLANLIGGFLSVAKTIKQETLRNFIALSAGFILAVTILDLYPDVIRGLDYGPLLILVGFFAIFVLENFFANFAHHDHCEHDHTFMGKQYEHHRLSKNSVLIAFLGFVIHTFFDGAAISARILVSPAAGILVFLAVLSHKIPEGFSMSALFQAGKFSRTKSFLAATALGVSTILGAIIVYLTKQTEFSLVFLALATGSFTYIVTSELVPYISVTRDKKSILFFLLGIGLFYLTSIALGHFGIK
ncbi:MAG: ZIP family metal transporter [Gammaproteobacteria bacterium]|nr:ZIP family metal transporter [Gammaproteobacteria bacterium]